MKDLTTKPAIDYKALDDCDVKHLIIKHIKNKRGRYIGTFVAVPINDKEVRVAWSKCHRIDLEKNRVNRVSSQKRGLQIAIGRMISGSKVPVAETLKNQMITFLNHITKYYQDKNVIIPVGIDHIKDKSGAIAALEEAAQEVVDYAKENDVGEKDV